MLTSWHNFFFAAFEPGGSVTVDKPPLGSWVQAASASIWGGNGFALALLGIPLILAALGWQWPLKRNSSTPLNAYPAERDWE